jgi:hypothetical protein
MWWAILRAEEVLDTVEASPELRLRAVHALSQVAGSYARLLETSDLEARLTALEARALERSNGHVPRRTH